MNEYPISVACPRCGAAECTRRRPNRLVAFVDDRVCRACNTRYTPPTPVWAGILFLMSGLTLPFLGLIFTCLLVDPFSIAGLICEGAFAALGVVTFVGGIRELLNSGTAAHDLGPGRGARGEPFQSPTGVSSERKRGGPLC